MCRTSFCREKKWVKMWQEQKTPGAKCQKHAYLCKNKLLSDGGTVNIIQQLHKADDIQLETLRLGQKRLCIFPTTRRFPGAFKAGRCRAADVKPPSRPTCPPDVCSPRCSFAFPAQPFVTGACCVVFFFLLHTPQREKNLSRCGHARTNPSSFTPHSENMSVWMH